MKKTKMNKINWKNSKLMLLSVLICLLISICAFSSTALAIPLEEAALHDVVDYYEARNDGEIVDWWEWLGLAGCTNDLGSFVPAATNTDSEVGIIIAKLIRGKDVTAEAVSVAAKIENGTYATPNDLAWGIIAVDAANRGEAAPIASYTKATALAQFAEWQKADGGFDFNANTTGTGDMDVTAAVAMALAPYEAEYQTVVNHIKAFLEASQNADGGYSSAPMEWGGTIYPGSPNANSTAMAVCALEALGIDSLTYYYGASTNSPVTALLGYQLADGGFKFVSTDTAANAYATKQAALALGDAVNSSSFLNTLQKNTTEYFTVTFTIDNGNSQPLLVKRSVPKDTTLADAANVAWVASGLAGSFGPDNKEYYLNNALASSTTKITADSSVLIIPDLTVEAGKNDYIGYFNTTTQTINVGGTVTLNLKGKTAIDADGVGLCANININGEASSKYTGTDGNVSLTFLNAGTYIISAGNPQVYNADTWGYEDTGDTMSRPYCKVVVNPVSAHSVKVNVQVEGKAANLVYEPTLTVNSDGTKAITALDALKAATTDIDFSGGMLNRVKTDTAAWFPNGYSYSIFYNGASASVGLGDLVIHNGDALFIFFGVWDTMNYNLITQEVSGVSAVKQEDGSYQLSFTSSYTPWDATEPIVSPITGATVTWGYNSTTATYITDENGQVVIPALQAAAGRHSLQIEKYDVNGAPTVVRVAPDYTVNIAEIVTTGATTKTLTDTTTPVDLVVPNTIATANVVASGVAGGTATLPAITVVNEQATGSALTMEIAAGTVVTSSDNTWNGTIQVPTLTTASVTGQTVQKAISVGVTGQTLSFDKPVRLVIPGAAGYKVGFLKTDGSLQEITTVLIHDNINAATAALTGSVHEAKIAVGTDMVVWTKHFTSFVSCTTPISGGGTATEQVYISVKNPKGKTYLSKKAYTFESGMTALSLLKKTDLDIDVSGNYVVGIEGLEEKSAGYPNSGWMFQVGSDFPTIASSSFKLEAGDYVQWLYSYDMGKDVGAEYEEEEEEIIVETPSTGTASFQDVAETHWAHDYIYYLANKGIVNGKTEGNYAPSNNITRAEFVTILARMSGADLTKYTLASYQDVKTNAWYIAAIAWATEAGVASGSNGNFNPSANISREEMAAMLSRYAEKVAKYSLAETNTAINFADSNEISAFAKDAVTAMQKAGIISGIGDNTFAPKNLATRAEAAKMLAILLQGIEKTAK